MSLDATTVTALIATMCAATAPLMQPVMPHGLSAGPARAGLVLACRVVSSNENGSRVALRREDGQPLPAGARIAWASVGTLAPVGETRILAESEARAGEWIVDSPLRVHGAGCTATAHMG